MDIPDEPVPSPRIRTVPIERVNVTTKTNTNTNTSRTRTTPAPFPLDVEQRLKFHRQRQPGERTVTAGAAYKPPPNRIGLSLADAKNLDNYHYSRFAHPPKSSTLLYSTTPAFESHQRRQISSGDEPGIQLVARYDFQEPSYIPSTASTPSAALPSRQIGNIVANSRAASLPTSHSAFLPSQQRYTSSAAAYRMPSTAPGGYVLPAEPTRPPPTRRQVSEHDEDDIDAARREPDYHLVESGSDVQLSGPRNEDVPAPAPTSPIGVVGAGAGAGGASASYGPETDILDDDSTASSSEDDVVKHCAGDGSVGNLDGMNHDDESAGTSGDEYDEKAYQELLERELIVEKYSKGPDDADVDPWENPDFELYQTTDRYGFVHKTADEVIADRRQKEADRIKKELRRERKWLGMLEEWKNVHPQKLPERIWKGVPEKLRALVWQRILDVEKLKAAAKPELYKELLMRARLVSSDIRQIDLDINRTYRDNLVFRRRYSIKQQSLFSVLAAYAVYNTEIGYCQGMSQIAGLFLMYMDEEDSFWCLHSLMVNRRCTMHGMFAPGFPKLHRFQEHYEKVIQRYLPRLKNHFEKEGVVPAYLTKWWFGCFLDRVPFPLALRIWDVFLYYGDSILIAMGYTIMDLHQKKLRKLPMERCLDFIQTELAKDFGYSFDYVMNALQKNLKKLQNDRMALPHPPAPDAPPEVPTKQLGPVLTRSMVDIRMDLEETKSRGSRANSIAGKSPAVNRRYRQQTSSPLVPHKTSKSVAANNEASPATTPPGGRQTASPHPDNPNRSPSSNGHLHQAASSPLQSLPPDPFRKHVAPPKPVIPDQDGFVPMSPRKKGQETNSRTSVYDNVPPTSSNSLAGGGSNGGQERSNVFGYGNHIRTGSIRSKEVVTPQGSDAQRPMRQRREAGSERVRTTHNNVTYVKVGDEGGGGVGYGNGGTPVIPPPDYDGSGDAPHPISASARFLPNEKLSRTASAYTPRRLPFNGQPPPSSASPIPHHGVHGHGIHARSTASSQSMKQQRAAAAASATGGRYYFEPDPTPPVPRPPFPLAHDPYSRYGSEDATGNGAGGGGVSATGPSMSSSYHQQTSGTPQYFPEQSPRPKRSFV